MNRGTWSLECEKKLAMQMVPYKAGVGEFLGGSLRVMCACVDVGLLAFYRHLLSCVYHETLMLMILLLRAGAESHVAW